MNLRKEIVGWIGEKVRGISLIVDLIDVCPLHCPTCAIGSIGRRKSAKMTIEMFRKIMDKAQREAKVRKVQLYVYSDPCMHPDLDLFVDECNRRGIESTISTMLQTTKCDFYKLIESRPTEFRISFPGWNKMTYYQAGARPEVFDKKFAEVVKLPRYKETKWTLVFHLYKDNQDEIPRVKELARKHNLQLVMIPAIFMVCDKVVDKHYTEQDRETISHLLETPEEAISRMKLSPDYCILWKQITIDAKGQVYLCQIVYEDRFIIANFLDTPMKEIRKRMRSHSFCDKCMKVGGNVYQECYADLAHSDDPVAEAEKKRRISGGRELPG